MLPSPLSGPPRPLCRRYPPSFPPVPVCHVSHRQTLFWRFICLWFTSPAPGDPDLGVWCWSGEKYREDDGRRTFQKVKACCASRYRLSYTSVTTMSTSYPSGFRQHRSNFFWCCTCIWNPVVILAGRGVAFRVCLSFVNIEGPCHFLSQIQPQATAAEYGSQGWESCWEYLERLSRPKGPG